MGWRTFLRTTGGWQRSEILVNRIPLEHVPHAGLYEGSRTDLHFKCAMLETKLNDKKHVRSRHGYEVNATVTASASCGRVAWVVQERRGHNWDVEDLKTYSENVIACTFISGATQKRLIGVYLPPLEHNGTSLDALTQAVHEATDPVMVLGDFNTNLNKLEAAQRRGPRTGDTATEPHTAAVENANVPCGTTEWRGYDTGRQAIPSLPGLATTPRTRQQAMTACPS